MQPLASLTQSWSTPTQGFLGGLGLATASSILLLFTGKVFGISGFVHRLFRPQSSSATHDAIAVLGFVVGGAYIRALEAKYIRGSDEDSPLSQDSLSSGAWTWDVRSVALSTLAGLLCGLGSKLQNGCTSGHIICGLSRFSPRSAVATLVFGTIASAVAQFHRPHLNTVAGYDWNLDAVDVILIWTYAGVVASMILAVTVLDKLQLATYKWTSSKLVSFGTALAFGLALRLSTLSDPAKVISFLITPFPDPTVFDPTFGFVAIGALPLAVLIYKLSNSRRSKDVLAIEAKKTPPFPTYVEERDPAPTSFETPVTPRFPLLGTGSWPGNTFGTIDARLLIGAVTFGVGWGIRGLCPGPAILNFGVSLYNISHGVWRPEIVHQAVWLSAFVLGGFAVV